MYNSLFLPIQTFKTSAIVPFITDNKIAEQENPYGYTDLEPLTTKLT